MAPNYGITLSETSTDGMNAYRRHWIQYITKSMVQHGLVPVYWDTGGLINRSTGAQQDPDAINWIVNATR